MISLSKTHQKLNWRWSGTNTNASWLHSIIIENSSASKVFRLLSSRKLLSRVIRRSASCRRRWSSGCERPSGRVRSTHRPARCISGRNGYRRSRGCNIQRRKWILLLVRPILMSRLRVAQHCHIGHCMTSSSSMRLSRAGNAVNIWSWARRSGLWWMHPSKNCSSQRTIFKLTGRRRPLIGSRPLLTS